MSHEEQIPVFKMVADYPNSPYRVGTLVTTDPNLWQESDYDYRLIGRNISDYPHLFQRISKEEYEQQNKKP